MTLMDSSHMEVFFFQGERTTGRAALGANKRMLGITHPGAALEKPKPTTLGKVPGPRAESAKPTRAETKNHKRTHGISMRPGRAPILPFLFFPFPLLRGEGRGNGRGGGRASRVDKDVERLVMLSKSAKSCRCSRSLFFFFPSFTERKEKRG